MTEKELRVRSAAEELELRWSRRRGGACLETRARARTSALKAPP